MRSRTITFEVPGKPEPKGRARVTSRGTYTPEKTKTYTEWVQAYARQAMQGREPMKGDVMLCVNYWLSKLVWKQDDVPNLDMLICDALSNIVYEDDCQIDVLVVTRGVDPQNPRVIIMAKGAEVA